MWVAYICDLYWLFVSFHCEGNILAYHTYGTYSITHVQERPMCNDHFKVFYCVWYWTLNLLVTDQSLLTIVSGQLGINAKYVYIIHISCTTLFKSCNVPVHDFIVKYLNFQKFTLKKKYFQKLSCLGGL